MIGYPIAYFVARAAKRSRGPLLALLVLPSLAFAQAPPGTIAGVVKDSSGGVLPGVTVTITNTDTGLERSVVTNAEGQYRGLLLPLGQYKVAAELQGFKKSEQTGIALRAGDVATINFQLSVGTVSETVTITAEAPMAQPGKIDLGRTIGDTEIHNLPLPSRNPYNFAFLQANVTGYENNEFGVPRINANGSQMHTNYQLDGNTNTEKDRAGLRLLPVSEVLVREVKVITNGFAPEFGQTTGMVYNAITPSGTNLFEGSASYRFKRNSMSAAPFFLAAGTRKPDTVADDPSSTDTVDSTTSTAATTTSTTSSTSSASSSLSSSDFLSLLVSELQNQDPLNATSTTASTNSTTNPSSMRCATNSTFTKRCCCSCCSRSINNNSLTAMSKIWI